MNKIQKLVCKIFKIRSETITTERIVYRDKIIEKLVYPHDSIIFEGITEVDTMDRMGVS